MTAIDSSSCVEVELQITLSAKLSKRKVTQEELDAAYVLPPFDVIDHYYDLL